jgi:hypothetical protein
MPKIIEDSKNNLVVYIYTNDHIPAHVHVFKGKKMMLTRWKSKLILAVKKHLLL